jgi:hypothetical protein
VVSRISACSPAAQNRRPFPRWQLRGGWTFPSHFMFYPAPIDLAHPLLSRVTHIRIHRSDVEWNPIEWLPSSGLAALSCLTQVGFSVFDSPENVFVRKLTDTLSHCNAPPLLVFIDSPNMPEQISGRSRTISVSSEWRWRILWQIVRRGPLAVWTTGAWRIGSSGKDNRPLKPNPQVGSRSFERAIVQHSSSVMSKYP